MSEADAPEPAPPAVSGASLARPDEPLAAVAVGRPGGPPLALSDVRASWAERHRLAASLEQAVPDQDLVVRLAGLEVADLDDAALVEVVAGWSRVAAWATAQQAVALAEMTRRAPSSQVEFVPDEVSARLAVSRRAATTLVERATALDAHPTLHQALVTGRADVRKVDVLLHHTAHLPPNAATTVLDTVLPDVAHLTPPQLSARVRRVELTLDPGAAHTRHQAARAERCVRMVPAPDSMAWIHALLPAVDATTIITAVDALAAAAPPGDARPITARRADALTDLCRQVLDTATGPHGPLPTTQHRHPHLHLTLNAAQLPTAIRGENAKAATDRAEKSQVSAVRAGHHDRADQGDEIHDRAAAGDEDHPNDPTSAAPGTLTGIADLAGYGPIPASVVREVIADASWRLTATNPTTGETIARSSRAYRPSPALAALIIDRDTTCTFPGCRTPATHCDIDHLQPFNPNHPAHTQTTETNLHTLCRHHHRMKTHTPWHPTRDPITGTTLWISPTGGLYTRDPHPTDPNHHPDPLPPPRQPPPTTDPDAHLPERPLEPVETRGDEPPAPASAHPPGTALAAGKPDRAETAPAEGSPHRPGTAPAEGSRHRPETAPAACSPHRPADSNGRG